MYHYYCQRRINQCQLRDGVPRRQDPWSGWLNSVLSDCLFYFTFTTSALRSSPVAKLRNMFCCVSLIWSLAVPDRRVGHTTDVLFPFVPFLCRFDWPFHGKTCPRLHVVHPGRAWPSSPARTWHCSLHYLFVQATPLFPHGVTIVC